MTPPPRSRRCARPAARCASGASMYAHPDAIADVRDRVVAIVESEGADHARPPPRRARHLAQVRPGAARAPRRRAGDRAAVPTTRGSCAAMPADDYDTPRRRLRLDRPRGGAHAREGSAAAFLPYIDGVAARRSRARLRRRHRAARRRARPARLRRHRHRRERRHGRPHPRARRRGAASTSTRANAAWEDLADAGLRALRRRVLRRQLARRTPPAATRAGRRSRRWRRVLRPGGAARPDVAQLRADARGAARACRSSTTSSCARAGAAS